MRASPLRPSAVDRRTPARPPLPDTGAAGPRGRVSHAAGALGGPTAPQARFATTARAVLRAVLRGVVHPLFGERASVPPDLLARYPMLAEARWRRGGLPLRVGGWCLGRATVAGITLWRTVWLARGIGWPPALLLHELAHVGQFASGPTFPLRYCWESLRHGYAANRYEREADAFAARALAGAAPAVEDRPRDGRSPRVEGVTRAPRIAPRLPGAREARAARDARDPRRLRATVAPRGSHDALHPELQPASHPASRAAPRARSRSSSPARR